MKLRSLPWKPRESAVLSARRVLPKMLSDFFVSGRKLGPHSDAREMHAFRLKAKRLRYTLEAFTPIYGPGLQHKIDSLRPIQNALGELNDCEVLLAELPHKLPKEVRAHIRKRAGGKHKEFLRYWREEFDAPDQDARWIQYLARSTRHKSAT